MDFVKSDSDAGDGSGSGSGKGKGKGKAMDVSASTPGSSSGAPKKFMQVFGDVKVLSSKPPADTADASAPKVEARLRQGEDTDDDEDFVPPSKRVIRPLDIEMVAEDAKKQGTPEEVTELYWIGTSGEKVTILDGVQQFPNLQTLSMRSNFIRFAKEVASLKNLVSLELYENRLRSLEGVQHCVHLTNLDISYNSLKS